MEGGNCFGLLAEAQLSLTNYYEWISPKAYCLGRINFVAASNTIYARHEMCCGVVSMRTRTIDSIDLMLHRLEYDKAYGDVILLEPMTVCDFYIQWNLLNPMGFLPLSNVNG